MKDEHKQKIRESVKRNWREGKRKPTKQCPNCGVWLSKNHDCKKVKEKQSKVKLANPTRYWLGKKRSKATCDAISKAQLGRKQPGGLESPCWMGGTPSWWRNNAREVMEKHLGRKLTKKEIVHHINENWKDNRIENLQIMNRAKHMRIHMTKNGGIKNGRAISTERSS